MAAFGGSDVLGERTLLHIPFQKPNMTPAAPVTGVAMLPLRDEPDPNGLSTARPVRAGLLMFDQLQTGDAVRWEARSGEALTATLVAASVLLRSRVSAGRRA